MMIYLALAVSATLAAAGQIMLKLGAQGQLTATGLINGRVLAGLACYGLGLLLWLAALTRLPLYVVYPFTLLTLGLVFLGSIFVLDERPTTIAIIGWIVIGVGVAIVAYGASRPT
jgi:drug/metabolite transporter (DMT)-like permease